jgi:HEAT repeat protein
MAEPLLHVLQNETDLEVLELALKSNMNNLSYSKDFLEAYKKAATHENVGIRKAAMNGLINSNNIREKVEGIEAEGIKFLDDADADIRASACYYLTYYKYKSARPKIEEIIKSSTDEKMVASCVKGITELWYDNSGDFDENAYKTTIAYLKKTPRTADTPDWKTVSLLSRSPSSDWLEKAKGKFNAKDFVAIMSNIAKDANADSSVRTSAIDAIAVHGVKADLEALDKAITEEGVVKREIASQMEKAK